MTSPVGFYKTNLAKEGKLGTGGCLAMPFFYNDRSHESSNDQWRLYLRGINPNASLKEFIAEQTHSIAYYSMTASQEQRRTMLHSAEIVSGTFEHGLNLVYEELAESRQSAGAKLFELSEAILGLTGMLDWRLTVLAEQQELTHLLLKEVIAHVRLPDREKERRQHIEKGFTFLMHAREDPDFFQDALNEFTAAEKYDNKDSIVLHYIGFLLFTYRPFDFKRAEENFCKSAKYAKVCQKEYWMDIPILRIARHVPAGKQKSRSVQELIPHSLLGATRACYNQKKYSDAIKYSQEAFEKAPHFLEAAFWQAKCLAADGQEEAAAQVLRPIIEKKPALAVSVVGDPDLSSKKAIYRLLLDLEREALERASIAIARAEAVLGHLESLIRKTSHLGFPTKEAIEQKQPLDILLEKAQSFSEKSLYIPLTEAIKKAEMISQTHPHAVEALKTEAYTWLHTKKNRLDSQCKAAESNVTRAVDQEIAQHKKAWHVWAGDQSKRLQTIKEETEDFTVMWGGLTCCAVIAFGFPAGIVLSSLTFVLFGQHLPLFLWPLPFLAVLGACLWYQFRIGEKGNEAARRQKLVEIRTKYRTQDWNNYRDTYVEEKLAEYADLFAEREQMNQKLVALDSLFASAPRM